MPPGPFQIAPLIIEFVQQGPLGFLAYPVSVCPTSLLPAVPISWRTPPDAVWARPSLAKSILSTIISRRVMATVMGIILVCRRLHFLKLRGVSNWLPFRSILFLGAR